MSRMGHFFFEAGGRGLVESYLITCHDIRDRRPASDPFLLFSPEGNACAAQGANHGSEGLLGAVREPGSSAVDPRLELTLKLSRYLKYLQTERSDVDPHRLGDAYLSLQGQQGRAWRDGRCFRFLAPDAID